jgi:hypothetical protein
MRQPEHDLGKPALPRISYLNVYSVGDDVVIVVLPLTVLPNTLSPVIHVQVFPLTDPVPVPTTTTLFGSSISSTPIQFSW